MRANTISFWRGRLPHWEVGDAVYFVTVHVAGALPAAVTRELQRQARLGATSQWRLYERIFQKIEAWLDRTADSALLIEPEIACVIREAIAHRVRIGIWGIHAYVIMPNHLHILLENLSPSLSRSMVDFKHWTAVQAAKTGKLKTGRLWQREWFDHWLRDSSDTESIREYIRNNPVKAELVTDYRDWPYASWK